MYNEYYSLPNSEYSTSIKNVIKAPISLLFCTYTLSTVAQWVNTKLVVFYLNLLLFNSASFG